MSSQLPLPGFFYNNGSLYTTHAKRGSHPFNTVGLLSQGRSVCPSLLFLNVLSAQSGQLPSWIFNNYGYALSTPTLLSTNILQAPLNLQLYRSPLYPFYVISVNT
ncbi:Protein of unknown function [Pyronema omphalodes CBS 100304]|uniref:Uncharacterized protein n=1 Tax=Pyronema omphalodes (strain CBS 100304) TaxID=1076935 RepID=U4LQV0_PYROM|nr:Protein of unknown function [Pyronema omphalodes CBS 100304]